MSLPDWLEPLPDAAQQRALDEWAIDERGISGVELMERAGAGLADVVGRLVPRGPIVAVCGKGNNGGDGLVCARRLRELGRDARVLLLGAADELRGDARANYERLPGDPPEPFDPARLRGAAGIVDAILGTGFAGAPREPAASAIEAINAEGGAKDVTGGAIMVAGGATDVVGRATVVVACDVPSGVDASTGEVHGAAVAADATVTFHAGKPGLWIAPGKSRAGEVTVVDIGIPPGGPGDGMPPGGPGEARRGPTEASSGLAEARIGLISERVVDGVPRRGRESTKFAAGSVLVCGGSIGLTGAPSMASEAAARAGAGYVTACVPASLNLVFETRLLEPMTIPLPDVGGSLLPSAAETVLARAARSDALVLGPGIGREPGAFELARSLAQKAELPTLIDADGLNAHSGRLASLADRTAATVLTPHAGELARLLETDSKEIDARRLHYAREASVAARAIVVLKGDDTLVAAPDGRIAVSAGGSSALATAGTGDVLSGVIGAYLAKRMDSFHAACAGVFVHARAGRLAAEEIGPEGVIAGDVIERLPRALAGPAPGARAVPVSRAARPAAPRRR